jgi:hypothetical protein
MAYGKRSRSSSSMNSRTKKPASARNASIANPPGKRASASARKPLTPRVEPLLPLLSQLCSTSLERASIAKS